ncbi:6-phosphofructo-2-kinase 1 [Nakaseomyces bracarensis]|uniref:6-phosphofructo-2-kinase 1 n=1 Tax=Nakaseomyces bracarensis TaxID=273131 RepID=A0ABR4NMZ2_9SACH
MFKPVNYSDNKAAQSDSDVEPTDLQTKHVTIHPEVKEFLKTDMPFQRRPLSDTPITSAWNSPGLSEDSTPTESPDRSTLDLTSIKDLALQSADEDSGGNDGEGEGEDDDDDDEGGVKLSKKKSRSFKDLMAEQSLEYPTKKSSTIDVPGLTKSKTSPDGMISSKDPGSKLIIVMVGLPATGKSFITNKLSRYLNYLMYYCKVFNVGNTRRQYSKEHALHEQDSSFFDPNNEEYKKLRDKWALDTLDELLDYLLEGTGSVAIFDATNSTKLRRKAVMDKIKTRNPQLKVLFLESICTNRALVERNVRLKIFGPDYKGKDPEKSLRDFKDRLANYLTAYEPIADDEDLCYIKMIDVGKKIIAANIEGFLASQTVYYLLNFNLRERQIWITRGGESEDNVKGRIGGDSALTERGKKYARALADFINERRVLYYQQEMENSKREMEQYEKEKERIKLLAESKGYSGTSTDVGAFEPAPYQCNDFFVWTSMRERTIETAQWINDEDYPKKEMRMLDELGVGDFDGMTYTEIQEKFPLEYEKRRMDKLRYRYPGIGGESYMDVINRVRPVITELERIEDNVLIITHRVVARVLLGYYMNLRTDIIANLDVPLHCVYCLEPKPYGMVWSLWEYNEEQDSFFKVPESDLNTTKVREIGLVHKERRYSEVPTAPPSANSNCDDFLLRRNSIDIASPPPIELPGLKTTVSEPSDANKLDKQKAKATLSSEFPITLGNSTLVGPSGRHDPRLQNKSKNKGSILMNND